MSASLDVCAHCGRCSRACPAGLPLREIFLSARRDLPAKKSLRQKVLFGLLAHPKVFNAWQPFLSAAQKLRSRRKKLSRKKERACLAARAFRPGKDIAAPTKSVLLFHGCLGLRLYPGLAKACETVLKKCGYKVIQPDLPCCGRLADINGQPREAASLASHALELISKYEFDFLATPCPQCLRQIREVWPACEELTPELETYAAKLAALAVDMATLVAAHDLPFSSSAPVGIDTIFWHKPCLMAVNEARAARALLAKSALCLVRDLPDNCCGGNIGGAYLLPQIAMGDKKAGTDQKFAAMPVHGQIAQKRRDEIMASGAVMTATGCPACKLSLEQALAQNGDKAIVRHWLEIYVMNLEK